MVRIERCCPKSRETFKLSPYFLTPNTFCLAFAPLRTPLRLAAEHHEGEEKALPKTDVEGSGSGRGCQAEVGDVGGQGASQEAGRRKGRKRG